MLSVKRTNASNTVKASVVVDGISLGEYSSIELLQLEKIINRLNQVHEAI